MPGVYFISTEEPITGQKTQVTAVFPSRSQNVAVKSDNDRKMAEIFTPKEEQTLSVVDYPYPVLAPPDPQYHLHSHSYKLQYPHPHPYQFTHPYPHVNPYLHSPHLPHSYYGHHGCSAMPLTFPPAAPQPFQSGYSFHFSPMANSAGVPWMANPLPPIGQQRPAAAMPTEQNSMIRHHQGIPQESYYSENEDNDDIVTSRQATEGQSSRRLRDILLIDDSVVRSLEGQNKATRQRLAPVNHDGLRVTVQSPLLNRTASVLY